MKTEKYLFVHYEAYQALWQSFCGSDRLFPVLPLRRLPALLLFAEHSPPNKAGFSDGNRFTLTVNFGNDTP